jgi:chromosomal replication initiator protein
MRGEAAPDELTILWRRACDHLRASLAPPAFEVWLEPLRPVSIQAETIYLHGPAPVRGWVERRYWTLLLDAVRTQAPDIRTIAWVPDPGEAGDEQPAAPKSPRSLPLDPRHTFERFVIGSGNRLAHAAALAVAELPGEAYNPLFLHGPPGLGKTHLLGSIADYLRRIHPELTVHHTTAERFTSDFVSALREHGPEEFKRRYRGLDALLIDDVQVLEGKQRTEEEFVHTFNALHAGGKQIVLSSDRPPEALSRLAERLRDRFQWGLCVELEPPDLRTRIAVLWRLASAASPEPPDAPALSEIAARVPGNVRGLEGALTRVLAFASILREPLSTPLVARALSRARLPAASPPAGGDGPTVGAIQDAVCGVLGITRQELLSSRRTPRIAHARQLAMYIARELTALSLMQIAREFDRDHTTVIHAVRSVSHRLEPGSETTSLLHKVELELGTRCPQHKLRD